MNEEHRFVVEEVTSVEAPPKARVDTTPAPVERQRDYLEGFLAQKPVGDAPGEPGGAL